MVHSPHKIPSMAARPPLVLLLLGMAAPVPVVAALVILQAGSNLTANTYIQSGNFSLLMQLDCNLVIYFGVNCCIIATWATGTWNTGANGTGCVASMQQDRDFVVYGPLNGVSTRLWHTNTGVGNASQQGNYYVGLDSDGSLKVMEFGSTEVFWSNFPTRAGAPAAPLVSAPPVPPAALTPGTQAVNNGSYMSLVSKLVNGSFLANGNFTLTLERDCNLRIQNVVNGDVLWESGSRSSLGGCELILQKNSTLLIRIQSSEQVIWRNGTNPGNAEAQLLILRGDGTVAILDTDGVPIWSLGSTGTSPPTHPPPPPPPTPPPAHPPPPPSGTAGLIGGIIGGVLGGPILLGLILRALRHYGYFDGKAKKELQLRLQNKGARSRALTLWQIRKATNNNARLLGRGGFGPVYYGKLQDGQEVAIKSLSATSNQGKHEFFNEIELLSVVHHKYLVSLVGYCIERKQRILVYEYMSGGDLRDRLHGEIASAAPLSWNQRKNIILQVAEGIQYLHEGCKPAIIHRDIKTNNILLNEKMVAKVADFGISKLLYIDMDDATHITTVVKGTAGYLDPEYYVSQKLTEKSDVYAYGVLLMEIITGRSLVDSTDHMYIVQKVRIAWKSKNLDGLADPNLEWQYDHKEFSGLVKLSLWCVKQSSSDRPSMFEVVHELREIGVILAGTSHPSEDVAGEDYSGMSMPDPLETQSSSSNLKNDMSDPLISAFSISSSNSAAGELIGTKAEAEGC